jgi:hypothetical protein
MSKERDLLGRWYNGDLLPEEYMKLMKETKELLAKPEHIVDVTDKVEAVEDRIARWHRLGYEQGKKASQREPLIYEHLEALVDKYHGYPMTLGRAIEKAHGIGGGE